ncbi:hypothetical protein TcBrA4_0065950 [Trypanosoma cruzi]|nr:hypothetical protein TcBrA4_0065950 [Trypanosoma cruzi]
MTFFRAGQGVPAGGPIGEEEARQLDRGRRVGLIPPEIGVAALARHEGFLSAGGKERLPAPDPEAAAKNTRGSRSCAYHGRLPGLSGRGDAASHLRTARGRVGGPGDTPFGVLKYKAKSLTGGRRRGMVPGPFSRIPGEAGSQQCFPRGSA